MYTYPYKHVIILMKKEAMNLKESEEGYEGAFEGGMEREECCSYIIHILYREILLPVCQSSPSSE